jgi:hypothetical protein
VTFFCVEVRDGQQESRDATDRVLPIYARQKIAAVRKLPLHHVCVPVLGADIVLHKIGERRQREAFHLGCDEGARAVDVVIKVPQAKHIARESKLYDFIDATRSRSANSNKTRSNLMQLGLWIAFLKEAFTGR